MMPTLNEHDTIFPPNIFDKMIRNDGFISMDVAEKEGFYTTGKVKETKVFKSSFMKDKYNYEMNDIIKHELLNDLIHQIKKEDLIRYRRYYDDNHQCYIYNAMIKISEYDRTMSYNEVFKIGSEEFNEEEIKIALKNYYPDRLI